MLELPPIMAQMYCPATNRDIRSWSFGSVTAQRKSGATDWEKQKGTLDDPRIFGPLRDYECACGKYKGQRYQGMICDRCGVKVTTRDVREKRFGHIELPEEIRHPWTDEGKLATFPVLPAVFVERAESLGTLYEELVHRTILGQHGKSVGRQMEETIYSLVRMILPMEVSAHEQGQNSAVILARGLALALLPPSTDEICGRCGYSLEGLDVIACPECGRRIGN